MKNTINRLLVILSVMVLLVEGAIAGKDPRYNIKSPNSAAKASKAAVQFHAILQGFNMQVWMGNMGCMGLNYSGDGVTPTRFGLEYPRGSGIEHFYGAGPWIGAIVDTSSTPGIVRNVKAVTVGYEGWTGPLFEFFGNSDGSDSFYVTSKNVYTGNNRYKIDDDGDGKIDEDEYDSKDNDNDGSIDEDFGAISERDVYVGFGDFYGDPPVVAHTPLGVRVWQKSLAWASAVKEPILPLQYYFMNVGTRTLKDVYVGFFADCDVGPVAVGAYYSRNSAGYFPELRTAYEFNSIDRPSTPIGLTVLGAPRSLDSLRYTFQWYAGGETPGTDSRRYDFMSSGVIRNDEYPARSDSRFFFSFGPFNGADNVSGFKPGDTLRVDLALISGEGLEQGRNNLKENAAKALELYARDYTTPPVPAAVPLKIITGDDRATLTWKWHPGDPRTDPMQTWDDNNVFVGALPADHWRRRNPELRNDTLNTTGRTGGRIFQGFRVWRSTRTDFNESDFALLAQYDIHDDLDYGEGGLLEDPIIDPSMAEKGYTYIDANLVRGRTYRYAVTSFSLPGVTLIEKPISGGGVDTIRIESPPVETGLSDNEVKIIIPFSPSSKVGEVKVVPNPYRTDVDYTEENFGYEGLGRSWNEGKRVIWFIHLPGKCTIRIFSLTGDLVATINHDDPIRQALEKLDNVSRPIGQEEWNLLTESGRAIASGIYMYTVESDFGRQVGKFVVIR